ncbi:patatin-like phospholipase family protein [Nakamurella sp. PAMC28650]|jgi:NTE family protein|nr:patatin-like phospholipase family protein [Nakamurella sp. PAMC28650]
MVERGLVLAGGGVAGIAWELGVLLGIRDAAADLRPAIVDADLIVGTSAGSTVAAQIGAATDLADLFARQLSPVSSEIEVDFDTEKLMAEFAGAAAGASSREEMLRRVGAWALAAATVAEPLRRAAVAGRLLHQTWPEREILIPAVDTLTGELIVFDRHSGVTMTDAVTASCAVPGVWPPVTISGHRYMDGGTRSGTNADLAIGCDRILVLTPSVAGLDSPMDHLAEEIESLHPAEVFVVHADDASIEAFGPNPLSPGTRAPAARAGRAVGAAIAGQVASFWR